MPDNMSKKDKTHWIVVIIYISLLCISLVVFMKNPNPKPTVGPYWNGLFQCLGPTIGTFLLVGLSVLKMAGKKISLFCGIGTIALLVVVSFICLALTMPIMMHI
jgi:hypothetical protein